MDEEVWFSQLLILGHVLDMPDIPIKVNYYIARSHRMRRFWAAMDLCVNLGATAPIFDNGFHVPKTGIYAPNLKGRQAAEEQYLS